MSHGIDLVQLLRVRSGLITAQAELLRAKSDKLRAQGGALPWGVLEDHRTEVIATILDAIDMVAPGLGTQLQNAMHLTVQDEPEQPR